MDLEMRLSDYNQSMRQLGDQRQILWEEAKAKASEALGLDKKKAEAVIQITAPTAAGAQSADFVDPQDSPRFRVEMYKHLNLRSIADLDEQAGVLRLAKLRPIYMEVYLQSVDDIVIEDGSEEGTPLRYKNSMSAADKDIFYKNAPGELIDEIFGVLSDKISMTEEERGNFGLPTTGSLPAAGKTAEDTNATPASSGSSTASATAGSQK
jgi:hypothetical protein